MVKQLLKRRGLVRKNFEKLSHRRRRAFLVDD
jgi:hypothetical protein